MGRVGPCRPDSSARCSSQIQNGFKVRAMENSLPLTRAHSPAHTPPFSTPHSRALMSVTDISISEWIAKCGNDVTALPVAALLCNTSRRCRAGGRRVVVFLGLVSMSFRAKDSECCSW
mmetsp:Transcript_23356/g.57994  ORF Transcript_23356/g.57994 Transcript_23356/m.57994 type:complete len:118 (+) Transcript_23356:759-1112(+)